MKTIEDEIGFLHTALALSPSEQTKLFAAHYEAKHGRLKIASDGSKKLGAKILATFENDLMARKLTLEEKRDALRAEYNRQFPDKATAPVKAQPPATKMTAQPVPLANPPAAKVSPPQPATPGVTTLENGHRIGPREVLTPARVTAIDNATLRNFQEETAAAKLEVHL